MKMFKYISVAALIAGAGLVCVSAQAAPAYFAIDSSEDGVWMAVRTAQGCWAIVSRSAGGYDLGGDSNGNTVQSTTWSGACGANGFAEGAGHLIYETAVGWGPYTFRMDFTMNYTDGVPHGDSQLAVYSNEDDYNDATPAGAMVLADEGDVRNPMPYAYDNGCPAEIDAVSGMHRPLGDNCAPGSAEAFRSYIAATYMSGAAQASDETGLKQDRRGPPPQIPVATVLNLPFGLSSCVTMKSGGTRWSDENNLDDPTVVTKVSLINNCGQDLLVQSAYAFGSSEGWQKVEWTGEPTLFTTGSIRWWPEGIKRPDFPFSATDRFVADPIGPGEADVEISQIWGPSKEYEPINLKVGYCPRVVTVDGEQRINVFFSEVALQGVSRFACVPLPHGY